MKNLLLFILVVTGAGTALASPPATEVQVSRPVTPKSTAAPVKTEGQVAHPKTTVKVQRPATSAPVNRPVTSVQVSRPVTQPVSHQLKTTTQVFHPRTEVSVAQPGSPSALPSGAAAEKVQAPAAGTKGGSTASKPGASSTAPTTMSGFQMPQAKDFKAAKLGNAEGGLGNPDDAEKSAAAAAFKVPKAEQVSLESVLKSSDVDKGSLSNKIKQATSK